jgi:hypothetical protein
MGIEVGCVPGIAGQASLEMLQSVLPSAQASQGTFRKSLDNNKQVNIEPLSWDAQRVYVPRGLYTSATGGQRRDVLSQVKHDFRGATATL